MTHNVAGTTCVPLASC